MLGLSSEIIFSLGIFAALIGIIFSSDRFLFGTYND